MTTSTAKLALEDGTVFSGQKFGADGEIDGEVCFNTSMTGYQEILTDPSYRGQIVTMTYPHIGNYGVNEEDAESAKPHLAGFIVKETSRTSSNFRAQGHLNDFLKKYGVVGLSGIDTRALVRRIRQQGALRGVLSTIDLDDKRLVAKACASPGLVGRDLVREVIPDRPMTWKSSLDPLWNVAGRHAHVEERHVVAMDFGMKWNILRHLRDVNCRVTILPGTADRDEILARKPAGVFLSNGPGDPEPLTYAVSVVEGLLPKVPMFGICLGHQLLALACGARTFKLKFGHRGSNQPVLDCNTGRVEITAQNHGFAVEENTLPEELTITHRNLNDNTIAGLQHTRYPAFSVQYHPEASAGPHDSRYLFSRFRQLMDTNAKSNQSGDASTPIATDRSGR